MLFLCRRLSHNFVYFLSLTHVESVADAERKLWTRNCSGRNFQVTQKIKTFKKQQRNLFIESSLVERDEKIKGPNKNKKLFTLNWMKISETITSASFFCLHACEIVWRNPSIAHLHFNVTKKHQKCSENDVSDRWRSNDNKNKCDEHKLKINEHKKKFLISLEIQMNEPISKRQFST